MSISGYIKATCKKCKETIDWYCSPIPSTDAEIIYTCNKCIEEEIEKQRYLSCDPTYG